MGAVSLPGAQHERQDAGRGRPLKRWFLPAAIGILLVVAVAVAAAYVTSALRPLLTTERLATALSDVAGRPVRIEAVALRPWRGRLEASGVSVEDLVTVGRVTVSVGLSSLWRREIVLSRILLEDVDLRVTAAADGGAVVLPHIPERVALGPVTALIGAIELARARAAYRSADGDVALDIEGLQARARPRGGALLLSAAAARVAVRAAGFDEVAERVEADARLEGEHLALEALSLLWLGEPLRAGGEIRALAGAPTLALDIAGRLPLGAVASRLGAAWAVAGVARVAGTLRGPAEAPALAARVSVPELEAAGVTARKVRGNLAWDGAVLTLTGVAAEALGGEVGGDLVMPPADPARARLALRLQRVGIADLERLAGRSSGLRGVVSAQGELRGDLRRPAEASGTLALEAAGVALPGEAARAGTGAVTAEARFAGGSAEIVNAEASWPTLDTAVSRLRGRVGLRDRTLAVTGAVTTDLGRLAAAWDQPGLGGRATVTAQAQGRWEAPLVTGHLEVPALGVRGVALTAVAVDFRLDDRTLHVTDAQATLGGSRAHVAGTLALTGPRALDLDALGDRLRLALDVRAPALGVEDLGAWLPAGVPAAGRVALQGRIEGTLAAWRAAGRAESAALTVHGERLERLEARFTAEPAGLTVSRLAGLVRGVAVTARGTATWDGAASAQAEAPAIDLAALPGLPERWPLRGGASARIEVTRRAGALSGAAQASATGVAIAGVRLGPGTLTAALKDGALDGALAFPEARLRATAQGRLAADTALTVRVAARDVALAPLLRPLLPEGAGEVGGSASAAAELAVPAGDPLAARGTLRLDPLTLLVAGETWTSPEPVVIAREPALTRVERLRLESRVGSVSASGTAADGGRLDLAVQGRLPLAPLAALRPEIREAAGTLEMTLRVAGTAPAPAVTGEGRIADGRLTLRDWDQTIRDLRARFTVSPTGLRLAEATGAVGGGTVRVRGDSTLEGFRPRSYRFTVEARTLPFAPVDDLAATWDADLELAGVDARAQLRGEARLLRGSYTRDLSVLRLLLERRPQAAPASAEAGLHLDLRVALADALQVRTRLARFRADGTLAVQGTAAAPVVFGTLEARDGQLIFRRQPFTLTTATARFVDPRRIDPILDVRGEARIRGYDVTLHLSGRSDDLQIRLASSPSLPEEDVLSLVVFGATREQIGRRGAGVFAGEMAGMLIQDLFGAQTDSVGVDVFELEEEEAGGRTLRVGKRLTPRTLVVYSQGLEEADRRRLRLEYQVFGPFVVAGEQDFRGGFGADVLVRLRFR